jgi:hypothetical protein
MLAINSGHQSKHDRLRLRKQGERFEIGAIKVYTNLLNEVVSCAEFIIPQENIVNHLMRRLRVCGARPVAIPQFGLSHDSMQKRNRINFPDLLEISQDASNPDAKTLIEVAADARAWITSPAFRTMFANSGARSVAPAAMLRDGIITSALPPDATLDTEKLTAPPV